MRNMKKILSFLLVLSMVLSYVPMPALAAEGDPCTVTEGCEGTYNAEGICTVCNLAQPVVTEGAEECQHSGGTATCTALANCDACGVPYGELAAHTGGEATCKVQAVCAVCTAAYGELAAHSYENGVCAGCGDVCAHAEYAEGKCIVCGSAEPDEPEECQHTGGTATCQEQAICEKCETAYGELAAHNYGIDADGKCDACGADCPHAEYAEGKCKVCGMDEPVQEPVVLTITAWSWVDEYEILSEDGTYATLPNAADWETLKSVLPAYITAMVDGAEVEIPVQWECETFPAEGEGQGTYELKAILPEGYALGEGVTVLELEVDLGVAEDLDTVASGDCGTNVNWTLDDTGLLTISGNGNMADYSMGQTPWYSQRNNIKSIVIENGVTSIGNYAFYWCTNLTTVTVKGNINKIGISAFENSYNLSDVTFMGDVGTIGAEAFYFSNCKLNLTINGNVTSFGNNVFKGATTSNKSTLTLNYNGTNQPNYTGKIYDGSSNAFKIYVTPAYYAQSWSFCGITVVCPKLNITVNVIPENSGTAEAQYYGTTVESLGMGYKATLVATPYEDYYLKEYQVVSGGVTIDESNSFMVGQENIVINAIFEAIPAASYTVSFDANGGTGNMDMMTVENGGTGTLPPNSFERKNYSFKDWNTAADGSGTSYADGASITYASMDGNITLYAQWDKITYSVAYNANGGTGTMEPLTVEASDENNYTFPECGFTAPDGKVFAGWTYRTETDTSPNTYIPGESIRISKDITVTAQWATPAAEVTIGATTTTYGTLELAAAAVVGETATVKLLDNVKLTEHLTFNATNLILDLNNKSISNNYLTLCNTVSITGPGTLDDWVWLDIAQDAIVTINGGTTNGIRMQYGSKLVLNGGSVTDKIYSWGDHGQGGPTVVVNADGVANSFAGLNVYFNITPTTKPTMPELDKSYFYYKIGNEITDATLEGPVTYDGNTYAMEGTNVTVSKAGLSACYCNNEPATNNQSGTFTFTMPAAVAKITEEPNHNHVCEYNAEGATITATCTDADDNCPDANGGSVTLTDPDASTSIIYNGQSQGATTEGSFIAGAPTVSYQYKATEGGVYGAPKDDFVSAGFYKVTMAAPDGETAVSVEYEIQKRVVTIAANNQDITYGGSIASDTEQVTTENLVEGHTLGGITLTTEDTNVTTNGTITPSAATIRDGNSRDVTENYAITYQNGTLTISKATAAITEPTATAIAYGQPLSASTLSDTNWQWADGSTVPVVSGDYSAVLTVDDSNYDYSGVEGYDSQTHTVTQEVSVQVNKATPAITVTAVPPSAAPEKTVTVTASIANPNNANLTDLPELTLTYKIGDGEPQTITGNSFIIPQGTAENTVITITATTAGNDKYAAASATTKVTVSAKQTQTIDAPTAGIVVTYGNDPFSLEAEAVGALTYTVDNDDVVSVDAEGKVTVLKAGSATITVTAAETKDYAQASVTVPITVNPATLTITAEDKTAVVDAAMPAFTYNVTGLVGNDALIKEPTLTCNTDMNTAGEFDIVPSNADAGDNYTISYVNGKLTVTKEYKVTVADTTNGTVTVSAAKAAEGTQIIVTAAPKNSWYKLKTLVVTNAAGTSITVTNAGDGKYAFTMPASDVTVTATFSAKVTSIADPTNPKTGDDFHLALWSSMAMTSLLGAVALVLNKKKFYQR